MAAPRARTTRPDLPRVRAHRDPRLPDVPPARSDDESQMRLRVATPHRPRQPSVTEDVVADLSRDPRVDKE